MSNRKKAYKFQLPTTKFRHHMIIIEENEPQQQDNEPWNNNEMSDWLEKFFGK